MQYNTIHISVPYIGNRFRFSRGIVSLFKLGLFYIIRIASASLQIACHSSERLLYNLYHFFCLTLLGLLDDVCLSGLACQYQRCPMETLSTNILNKRLFFLYKKICLLCCRLQCRDAHDPDELTHCVLVTPCGDIKRGQHWLIARGNW